MPDASIFKVYPRGFLGAKLQDRVQRDTALVQNNMGFIPVKLSAYKRSNGINDFNHTIEELYAAYIREEAGVTGFDFRERALKAALHAFGTHWFDVWFLSQLKSPFVGPTQRDFLDDCLRFLRGERRHMFLENWAPLLTIENAEGEQKPSKITTEYFMLKGTGRGRKVHLEEALQDWCSKPNGFEDLLGTLHLLFGASPN